MLPVEYTMAHINVTVVNDDILLAGDKDGGLTLFKLDDLSPIYHIQVASSAIQSLSLDPASNLFAALCIDYSVVLGQVIDYDVCVLSRISGLDYVTDDGFDFHQSESQAIALLNGSRKVAFRAPNSTCTIVDFCTVEAPVFVESIRYQSPGDIVTLRWHSPSLLIAGLTTGELAITDLVTSITREISVPAITESIHWFEPEDVETYLVATDARRVALFNINTGNIQLGPAFARDDFEHITRDTNSGRIFASSFDRNLYELDRETLAVHTTLYTAPFKLRWIDCSNHEGRLIIIAQVRNGSILKIDVATGRVLARYHGCKSSFWSAIDLPSGRRLFGEGDCYRLSDKGYVVDRSFINFETAFEGHYVKRAHANRQYFAVGGTNGWVICFASGKPVRRLYLEAAIRDLSVSSSGALFAVTEAGSLWHLAEIDQGEPVRVFQSPSQPLWSLAHNEQHNLVAVAERIGRVVILDIEREFFVVADTNARLPKRMKWITPERLLVVRSNFIDDICYTDGNWHHEEAFFSLQDNTVEDFIALDHGRVLAIINYNRYISICNLSTGDLLSKTYWGSDYMKGLIKNTEQSFTVFGRDQWVKNYQLIDNNAVMQEIEDVY